MKQESFTLYVLCEPDGTLTWNVNRSKKALISNVMGSISWSKWYKHGWRIKKAKCTIIE